MIRAKFRCNNEAITKYGPELSSRTYEFTAVYDDGTPENQRFAKASPSGTLKIAVDNPAATFEPGKLYYLDFTPADQGANA